MRPILLKLLIGIKMALISIIMMGMWGLEQKRQATNYTLSGEYPGTDTDDSHSPFHIEDSGGTIRAWIKAGGIQKWQLSNGGGEIGKIEFSTPHNNPGIGFIILAAPDNYTDRFQMENVAGKSCSLRF